MSHGPRTMAQDEGGPRFAVAFSAHRNAQIRLSAPATIMRLRAARSERGDSIFAIDRFGCVSVCVCMCVEQVIEWFFMSFVSESDRFVYANVAMQRYV